MRGGVRVTELAELTPGDWDAAVAGSGQPFRFSHRAAAGVALAAAYASYAYRPHRVRYDDGTCLLLPLVAVQRRLGPLSMLLAMPLGLEGRPLTVSGQPAAEHLTSLLGALEAGRLDISGGIGGSPPAAGRVSPLSTHVLDLTPGYETIWSDSFPAKTRNMCRKAERSGLVVERDERAEAISAYVALYRSSAAAWGYAEAPHPGVLFEQLIGSGFAELWVARLEETIVGGAVMLCGSDDLLYWSGAMNREFRHVAPSNAIIRAAVEDACGRGISYLDFGASTGLSGVEAFKRSFGAEEHRYTSVSLTRWGYRQLDRVQQGVARVRAKAAS